MQHIVTDFYNMEMSLLPECFRMLIYGGMWMPTKWSPNSLEAIIYQFYSLICVVFIYTLTVSEIFGAIFLTKSLSDFMEISFLLVSTINVCGKVASIKLNRSKVIRLMNMLMEKQCLPRNEQEVIFLRIYDKIIRLALASR